jgi:hypothetical protein
MVLEKGMRLNFALQKFLKNKLEGPQVFFRPECATETDVHTIVQNLPRLHDWGDRLSVWPSGTLSGPQAHDQWIDRRTRNRARSRTTVMHLQEKHTGTIQSIV